MTRDLLLEVSNNFVLLPKLFALLLIFNLHPLKLVTHKASAAKSRSRQINKETRDKKSDKERREKWQYPLKKTLTATAHLFLPLKNCYYLFTAIFRFRFHAPRILFRRLGQKVRKALERCRQIDRFQLDAVGRFQSNR